jgi:glutaredoxin
MDDAVVDAVATEAPVRVFWAPGCTSCLRTKEFLTRHGVAFESVNVAAGPDGMRELQALGARSVPVVARGGRFVYAQSLADVAAFLAMDVRTEARLAPAVLVERVNIVVPAAMRYVRQMSHAELDGPFRNSWAPPRGLAHHVVRIVEAFLDAVETPEELTYESTMRGTHEVVPGQDVIGYADAVLARFNAWWSRCGDRAGLARMATYWGEQSMHEVLERTTWHAAQHTRQLIVVLDSLGREVDGRLGAADLQGLPLPEKAWDDDR